MYYLKIHSVVALACMTQLPDPASAGAEATVHACVYFADIEQPLEVTFTPKRVHCMYKQGTSAKLTVSSVGVHCKSLGHVEGKSSSTGGDVCATADSVWDLSYTIKGTAYSGSTSTNWWHPILSHQHVKLLNPVAGTVLCASASLCNSMQQSWDNSDIGDVYIIFKPSTVSEDASKAKP
jgi:hypothetical protein